MSNPMMDLKSLVEKTPGADLLREMISLAAAQRKPGTFGTHTMALGHF